MAFDNFKPTIWSDMIFSSYDKRFVFAPLANRDYEGSIKNFGDQVKINEIGEITASDYTGSVNYQTPSDASKYLQINQKKYAAVSIDDVDVVQANPKFMGEVARKMGVSLSDTVDQYISGLYAEAGIESGSTGSPTAITSVNINSTLANIASLMSDNNCPEDGRVMVVPPWLWAKIHLGKIAYDTNNSEAFSNGYKGKAAGFEIYVSNNISHSGSTWYAPMFFIKNDTIAFAEQLNKVEAGRREDEFADYIRSLMIYGAKVVRPSSLAVLYCSAGSETTI